MRPRTAVAVVLVLAALGAAAAYGIGVSDGGGTFTEVWVSDTPRDNEVNHHAVGVGPDDRVIVAPVAEAPNADAPITNESCALVRLAPDDGAVRWRASVAPDACFTHALTEPVVADADGDGTLAVYATTTENALIALDPETGRDRWRVSLPTYGYGRPTVVDLHPTPGREIVASTIGGDLVAVRPNGSVVWRADLNDTAWTKPTVWDAPVVADVDGDGETEVLVATNRGTALLAANGTVERLHESRAVTVATAPAADGQGLTVYTTGTAQVRARSGATGAIAWKRSLSSPRIRHAADVNDDGAIELFVGTADGTVYALDGHTGQTVWETTVAPDVVLPPPVLGDVDGDDRQEVLAVANDGTVAVLDATTGRELAAYERAVPIWTFATPADIDGDGREEILVRYGDGRVVALSYG